MGAAEISANRYQIYLMDKNRVHSRQNYHAIPSILQQQIIKHGILDCTGLFFLWEKVPLQWNELLRNRNAIKSEIHPSQMIFSIRIFSVFCVHCKKASKLDNPLFPILNFQNNLCTFLLQITSKDWTADSEDVASERPWSRIHLQYFYLPKSVKLNSCAVLW